MHLPYIKGSRNTVPRFKDKKNRIFPVDWIWREGGSHYGCVYADLGGGGWNQSQQQQKA
jgi:hypothetical protein